MDMPLIGQFYVLSLAVGFLFVVVSAAFAGLGHHGGDAGHIGGHDIGHTGGGHGHAGIGHGSGHSPGHHTGSHGHVGGHDAGGHSGHSGHSGHGGAGGDGDTSSQKALQPNTASGAKHAVQAQASTQPILMVLGLVNPTMLSVLMASIGVAGIFSWKLLPIPIEWTLAPALIFGLLITRMIMGLLSLVMRKLSSSSFNYTLNDMIGREAEVTSTIKDGRLGEISYVMGRRNTGAARTKDPSITLPRGTKVIISDLDENGSFFVEVWPDEGTDFEAQLRLQAKPAVPSELERTDQVPAREKLEQEQ